jgi:hypothetical protein
VSGGCREGHGPRPSGPQEGAAASNCRPGRQVRKAGRGPRQAAGQIGFSFIFFYRNTVLIDFVQFLGKFHTVFSTQIIPTKICLENSKVTETFLESSKLINFLIHVSAANS